MCASFSARWELPLQEAHCNSWQNRLILQPYDEVGPYAMDVATSMYDHNRSGAPMQHMNRTSATSYHHQPAAAGGGVSNAMSAVSDIHKRDKELIYGYVRTYVTCHQLSPSSYIWFTCHAKCISHWPIDWSICEYLSDHTPKLSNVA